MASKYFLTDFILNFKVTRVFFEQYICCHIAVNVMVRGKKDICIAIFLPMCLTGLEVLGYGNGIPPAS